VEGDDTNEPIADALRAILDGHINLTRDLATQNHYPAIDVLTSISRVMDDIIDPEQRQYANKLKETLAVYRKAEDLINIGAYVAGSNTKIDYAIEMIEKINLYLKQDIDESTAFDESIAQLARLFES
jgi:flagellum-specific ATP synthase